MSSRNSDNSRAQDRRKHQRFPVVRGMIEPITVQFDRPGPARRKGAKGPRSQPAILTDLSAGGMSLLMFLEPPRARRLEMLLGLPGLEKVAVEGKVVHVNEKGQTFSVGIAFTRISKKHQERINQLASDHLDCETRIGLRLPEACVPGCSFHPLCAKPQKAPRRRAVWKAARHRGTGFLIPRRRRR